MNRDEHISPAQWQALTQRTVRKYKNIPTTLHGRRFDSRKEAARASVLLSLQAAGVITELVLDKRELRYPLVVNGVKVAVYVADFRYRQDGVLIIEDTKGYRTPVYRLKKRLMQALYTVTIHEV